MSTQTYTVQTTPTDTGFIACVTHYPGALDTAAARIEAGSEAGTTYAEGRADTEDAAVSAGIRANVAKRTEDAADMGTTDGLGTEPSQFLYTIMQMGTVFYCDTDRSAAVANLTGRLEGDAAIKDGGSMQPAIDAEQMVFEAEHGTRRTMRSVGIAAERVSALTTAARERGEQDAATAATWAPGNNAEPAERLRVLDMLRDGDGEAWDYLPEQPNLSGEWADAPTPTTLAAEIAGVDAADLPGDVIEAISDAWEEGVSETFGPTCETELAKIAEPDSERLAEFVRGYVECALWSSTDPDTEAPLDGSETDATGYDADDLAPETRTKIETECSAFIVANSATLRYFESLTGRGAASQGHDLWLTRNGHGAGFWDRYPEAAPADRKNAEQVGDELSAAAKQLGESTLYPGDDGKLYV